MNGISSKVKVEFYEDSLLPKRQLKLQSAELTNQGRVLVVINDEKLQFPGEYLLRFCECAKCFSSACLSHIRSLSDLYKADLSLKSVTMSEDGKYIEYVATNDHSGRFTAEWLYNRRMTQQGWEERNAAVFLHKPCSWPVADKMHVEKATYSEVTETEMGMQKFINNLIKDGLFIITGTPDRRVADEFGEKTGLAPIMNHYGPNWIVENVPVPTNHAYSSYALDLHIDQAFLMHCPNIQLLHCMTQSEVGGESIMSDGIRAANLLKERHPEYFHILTTLEINQKDVISHYNQQQYYVANRSPTIVLNKDGDPVKFMFNSVAQSSFFSGSPEQYEEYERATKAFVGLLNECSITFRNEPGDIMVFDNERVLHGRASYDKRYERKLEGWYLSWDMMHSRLRVSNIKTAQN
ncbi:gamma-butyrobetaine dioxygenase-like [Watersipora subatra]|uniref:gamma-butyrobetaine dioxygenase-like n=1 Tax=Watersipora subatra TaxID=2589382 RepID=UPI00355C77C6